MVINSVKSSVRGTRFEAILGPAYVYAKYALNGGIGFERELHSDVTITTPAEWAGTDQTRNREFFGYYDKTPWSSDMNYYLTHHIKSDTTVDVVVYDKKSQTRRRVGETRAWNHQQGAMAQWISSHKIVFNAVSDGELKSVIVDQKGNLVSTLPVPVQSVSPSGNEVLSLNYRKFDLINPQYGYGLPINNFEKKQEYNQDGIWRVKLDEQTPELLLTLTDLMTHSGESSMRDSHNWINHIMYSPNGSQFVFMHRWGDADGKSSRLFVANSDGSDLKLLMNSEVISHYSWIDEDTVVVWGRTREEGDGYFLVDVSTGTREKIGQELNKHGDGHPSAAEATDWLVTDSYPNDAQIRHLLVHDLEKTQTTEIGRFHSSLRLRGKRSCDLHPRWSPDASLVSIDSSHKGHRGTYILNLNDII